MNQQRTRRFRNAKDREILAKEEDRLRRQYKLKGRDLLPTDKESEVSDSNVITPGTEFMSELSKRLQTYIRLCISNHPTWKGLKDTDLIMLALATHEVHFSILRLRNENVLVKDLNHQCLKNNVERMSNLDEIHKRKSLVKKPYHFLHVWILREYLNLDFKMMNLPENFESDIERLIDDFIFICFFGGNDFLPPMPTLDIYEGAIDLLILVYKEEFKNLGGYLVDVQRVNDSNGGYINLKRVEKFILAVGEYEDKIFTKRSKVHENKLRRMRSEDANGKGEEEDYFLVSTNIGGDSSCNVRSPDHNVLIVENTKMLKEELKSYAREISDLYRNGRVTNLVELGDHGWKKWYYNNKFSADTEQDMENMRKVLVEKYAEGLCWVLLYYFSDVPSWTWFFPYHYGPFASDLRGLSSTKPMFRKGFPFKPFDQLMAILPPMSGDINGFVDLEQDSENVIDSNGLANDLDVLCVDYHPPNCCVHIPRMLDGTTIPETVASESDIEERPLWHDIQRHHRWWINRSYNHVQEAKRNHSDGFESSSCPGVIVKGGGSGWSPRGRGYNATSGTVQKERINIPSFGDTYGRGSRVNSNVHQTSRRWTDSSSNISLEQRQAHILQSTTYPAIRTNNMNDQLWSVRNAGSGFGNSQALQRWGGTQSRNDGRW
ncbi:hypothetical protein L6452_33004 [Arctium lappa]|uniref:Uncharacterized protein n=1 Tax=Arctium lappa TaxID=4217 RepID=A0ACB8Z6J4_ARCLA|nr:hypothetical protein L6452_33004 [Arctium lappa]